MKARKFDEKIIRTVIEKHYKDLGVYRTYVKYKLFFRILFYAFVALVTADFLLESLVVKAPFYISVFGFLFLTVAVTAIDHQIIGRRIYKIYYELNDQLGISISYKNVCELVDEYCKTK